MVALSASRLVCSAIEVITLTTLPISAEDTPSLETVSLVLCATPTAVDATSAAWLAFWAISRMDAPISSLPAAADRTLVDTSPAAPATTPACAAASCALPAIFAVTPVNCAVLSP